MTPRSSLLRWFAVLPFVMTVEGHATVGVWPIAQPGVQWICNAGDQRWGLEGTPDGTGGAFFTWCDARTGNYLPYLGHMLADGTADPEYTAAGRAIANGPNSQNHASSIADGAGGLYVVWDDPAGAGIHLQRLGSDGNPAQGWPAAGRLVSTLPGQYWPSITRASDGQLLVAWLDQNNINAGLRRMQRLDPDGTQDPAWPLTGQIAFASTSSDLYNLEAEAPLLVADDTGGAYLASVINGPANTGRFRVQHLLADGNIDPEWSAEGTDIQATPYYRIMLPRLVRVEGGLLLGWAELLAGQEQFLITPLSIQRVAANGATSERHTLGDGNGISFELISDDAGGAWASTPHGDLRVFHLGSNGYPLPNTPVDGRIPATPTSLRWGDRPALRPGPDGSVDVIWGSASSPNPAKLRHTRVSAQGTVDIAQPTGGTVISVGPDNTDYLAPVCVRGLAGSLLLGWGRGNYPQYLGVRLLSPDDPPVPQEFGAVDVANDEGGWLRVTWSPSLIDIAPWSELRNYSVWRASSSSPNTWTFVDSVRALRSSSYSLLVPTTFDSVAGSHPTTLVRVVAHDRDGIRSWSTAALACESVDNLAPSAPEGLHASNVPTGIRLDWDANPETDVVQYAIHRGFDGAFVPTLANRIALRFNVGYVDAGGAGPCYKVIAIDSHGNAGSAAVVFTNAVLDAPGKRLVDWLGRAEPNPARATTSLRFVQATAGPVRITVHDPAGRLVRTLLDASVSAGPHAVSWDLTDPSGRLVGPGIYWLAVTRGTGIEYRRSIVLR